jgi:integrating conjugative element membrane protein (TIGR03747 family)
VGAADTFLRTAAAGLQLFSLRLGVLALSAPFIGLVAIGAAADGLVTWYWRRTSGGRESGFVFHRAKRTVAMAALGLCFAYLVPPVAIDGRISVDCFAVVIAIALRLAVGHFKKYI